MGVSNPGKGGTKLSNPAKTTIEYSGSSEKGYFSYWDKEKKSNVDIKMKFKFMILQMWKWRAKSYDQSSQKSYGSNIIGDLKGDEVCFWESGGGGKPQYVFDCWKASMSSQNSIKAVTYYDEGKKGSYNIQIDRNGKRLPGDVRIGLYLFVMLDNHDLAVVWLKGDAIGRILDLWNTGNYEQNPVWIKWDGNSNEKSGNNEYLAPKFSIEATITDKDIEKAIDLDSNWVQPFLGGAKKEVEDEKEEVEPEVWHNVKKEEGFSLNSQSQNFKVLWNKMDIIRGIEDATVAKAVFEANVLLAHKTLTVAEKPVFFEELKKDFIQSDCKWGEMIDKVDGEYVFSDLPF